MFQLHRRRKLEFFSKSRVAHHWLTAAITTSNPSKTGTMIVGTSQSLNGALSIIAYPLKKKARQSAGLSSAQKGKLLLLRLLVAGLAITLVLLRGRLGLAWRDGLGGFIGSLRLCAHSISSKKYLKPIFQVHNTDRIRFQNYNDHPVINIALNSIS